MLDAALLAAQPLEVFDKNLLFDGKRLWKKKDPVKEKNRSLSSLSEIRGCSI
jgi:hypothetical protein